MRIDITRSGGLAGIIVRRSFDTAELPDEQAAKVEQVLHGAELAELQSKRSSSASKVDRFQYDVTIIGDNQSLRLSTGEAELPTELRQLLDELLRRY